MNEPSVPLAVEASATRAPLAGQVAKMVASRLLLGLFTLFIVSVVIFAAVEMLPGDFASSVLGQSATPETVAAFQDLLGLDRPPVPRYLEWIGGVLQGDFGASFASFSGPDGQMRAVVDVIGPRLWNTLFLAGLTSIVAVPLSLALGLLAALYRNSVFDRLVNLVTLAAIAVPEFFVAYILILAFAVVWMVFPAIAIVSAEMPMSDRLMMLALPVLTLTLGVAAHMMRMTRAAIINLLSNPYIEMARLKGLSPVRVIWSHALPNAWAPIVTVVTLNLAYLMVGVVVVEVVFAYPGIGQLMIDAVASRDIPVVQACSLIFASVYIILNLVADIVSIVANPRLVNR